MLNKIIDKLGLMKKSEYTEHLRRLELVQKKYEQYEKLEKEYEEQGNMKNSLEYLHRKTGVAAALTIMYGGACMTSFFDGSTSSIGKIAIALSEAFKMTEGK